MTWFNRDEIESLIVNLVHDFWAVSHVSICEIMRDFYSPTYDTARYHHRDMLNVLEALTREGIIQIIPGTTIYVPGDWVDAVHVIKSYVTKR